MLQTFSRVVLTRPFTIATVVLLSTTTAWSGSYKILHSFQKNSSTPSSGLVLDKAGNAYGTTAAGGFDGFKGGTVYQISPTSGYHIIYGFSGSDGEHPQGNLAIDANGNLYGTTVYGGANKSGCNGAGCGTVFRLSPPTNGGAWTETVLYSFSGGDDGANPQAGVILDSVGNLYGTTTNGGTSDFGIVFQLASGGNGSWVQNVLYSFQGTGQDSGKCQGGLIFDSAGNLYGMTGVSVFELLPAGGGQWNFDVIYLFKFSQGDGEGAAAGLTWDEAGNLYGTTTFGGEFNFGTVFQLMPNNGVWTETIVHSFAGDRDGATPMAGLVVDGAGNLYGTTYAGGSGGLGHGFGTVFELSPVQNGWTEKLFRFPGDGLSGTHPTAPIVRDSRGRIYGTAQEGGPRGLGVLFQVTP